MTAGAGVESDASSAMRGLVGIGSLHRRIETVACRRRLLPAETALSRGSDG